MPVAGVFSRHTFQANDKEPIMVAKEEFRKKVEAQLKQWDVDLEQLKAKAHLASENARVIFENELEELKGQRARLQLMLTQLSARSGNAWEDLRDGMEKSWSEMRKALEKVSSHFR
jgi:hypothetical protein